MQFENEISESLETSSNFAQIWHVILYERNMCSKFKLNNNYGSRNTTFLMRLLHKQGQVTGILCGAEKKAEKGLESSIHISGYQ